MAIELTMAKVPFSPASTRRPRDAVPWHRSGGQSTPDLGKVEWRCQTRKMESLTIQKPSKNLEITEKLGI
jgi:hypothetical protein